MSVKIDEIRSNVKAFKHNYTVNPKIQPCDYEETVGPYFEILLDAYDKAINGLKNISIMTDVGGVVLEESAYEAQDILKELDELDE